MMRIFRYFLAVFAALGLYSCHGYVDPEENGGTGGSGEPETGQTEEVPDGVLRIFADKTRISADGNDEVTFRVMFGKEDVSTAKTLQLIRKFDGEEKYMAYGANKFSTVTAGTYEFTAKYYYGGNNYTDNSVTVVAESFFSGEEKDYAQRVLGVYFTSTGCTSCPTATNGIKSLQKANPDMISVVAFHSDMGAVADPMMIPETAEFNSALGGFDGLPRLFWNMRLGTHLIGPKFDESYAEELAAYTPNCGVAIDTELESGKLKIDLGITSNVPSIYRYIVFLVEDGIVADQTGDKDYVHNNVVRDVLTGASGDKINDNLPLTVGVEVKASKTVTLSDEWNTENMRVVVAAMVSEDGGKTWTANNVNECKVGGNAPYVLKSDIGNNEELAFNRHVLVAEFTGGWCINCPEGYDKMTAILAFPQLAPYKEHIHVCAFHSDEEGKDDLAVPETQDLIKLFKGLAYPGFTTDFRESGILTDTGASLLRPSIEAAFTEHLPQCGVSVASDMDSDKTGAEVTVKVTSLASSVYRVLVLVVEDKVTGWQKTTMYPDGIDDYLHRHVVRKVVTTYVNTFTGEKLTSDGVIGTNEEVEGTWTVEVDGAWNLENTEIYAIALDADGYVDNMNVCAIDGGDSGYDLK
ncbi:MAG: Omp28-related outer membrane protein [Bacteroidales bacterium]|nr:Omp28-related outer membrane protein [Bacteroidales bacterium]